VATDDVCWLQDKLVPLPDPALTIAVLRDQNLSSIMPPLCRPPQADVSETHGWLTALARVLRERAVSVLLAGLVLFICLSIIDATSRQDDFSGRRFTGAVCLLASLLVLVCVWPNRNLDSTALDRKLHRTLAFHFMARNDYKQAALQFTAVLRLQADSPDAWNDSAKVPDHLRTFALVQQSIARVATTGDSNLVGFLNENLKTSGKQLK
jgi:hypothetical protein